jgi:hypothetical protein
MRLEGLQEFAREGPQQGGDAPISLHDLLARGTTVHWGEAVAIVEEMCEVAVAMSGDEALVPSLADVVLDASGRVTISRHGHGEKSPTAAGRALHALLANADVPVPLRLFVTQSTAPETHRSLRAFAEGLAYFGRPNRTEQIRDVYKRAADLVRLGVEPTLAPPPVPLQEKETRKESPDSKKSSRGRVLRWAAACMLLVFAAGAAWMWWSASTRGTATEGTGVLSQASAALTDLANQVRERLSPAVSTSPQAPAATSATGSRPRPRRRAAPTSVGGETPLASPQPSVAGEIPLASRQLSIAQPGDWQVPVAVPAAAIPAAVATIDESAPPDPERLFTKQDADVKPPVMRYPQLTPPQRESSSRATPVNNLEVVVASDGTVERVRFVDGPVRMMDIMLVGSIKTWRFTPAFKDGEPVRYRTVISWSAVP